MKTSLLISTIILASCATSSKNTYFGYGMMEGAAITATASTIVMVYELNNAPPSADKGKIAIPYIVPLCTSLVFGVIGGVIADQASANMAELENNINKTKKDLEDVIEFQKKISKYLKLQEKTTQKANSSQPITP